VINQVVWSDNWRCRWAFLAYSV